MGAGGVGGGGGVGAKIGALIGVTALDALDAVPVPAALIALTVKVYTSPPVRPDTVHPRDTLLSDVGQASVVVVLVVVSVASTT